MANFQGTGKAQSQGTAVATITGSPVLGVQSTSGSVSKGQGKLTQLNAGGITFTMTAVSGTFGPPADPAAATYLNSSITSISSLDTGRIGYVSAWGGNEFGYAYSYSILGAPAGVTISGNLGILTFASTVAPGSYTFQIKATNRENPAISATLPYTMTVATGVTSGRTGSQVLHKTYDPHSGTYGTPTGSDWTAVLNAIKAAILADQASNGDERLRATIPFHKGATYQYTDNHWLNGVQYYDVTATGTGANPILQNNSASATFYEAGPLNIGDSGSMNRNGSRKVNSALINTVAAGATSVFCTTPAQVSRLIVGRWHTVIGGCIQLGGEPPNCMYVEYVRVLSVNGTTGEVALDRKLRFAYSSTWWETAGDDISFGRGWICPADTDSNGRMTLRGRFYNINFQANPNATGPDPKNIMLLGSHIQSDFDTCTTQALQVTLGKHFGLYGCTMSAISEPDKLSETLFLAACTMTDASLGGATGFQYVLMTSCSFVRSGVQISPRQMRSISCTFDADTSSFPPYTFSYNGPSWYLDFESPIFTGTVSNSWTFAGNPYSPITIGSTAATQAVWNGNRLQIATTVTAFQDWLTTAYFGGIVAVSGLGPITTNWGYISNVTSDEAGGALWLDIQWVNGTKPTSGTIDIGAAKGRRLLMNSPTFSGAMTYADGKFAKQTVTGQTSWDFPAALPPPYDR